MPHCGARKESLFAKTMKLLQFAVAIALALCLIACGGSSSNPAASPNAAVSVTSNPQLVALWAGAQQYLATNNIVLNAAAMVVFPGISPDTHPPDQRALTTSDAGVTVTTIPDLTVSQLQAENPGILLQHNTDPTGIVHCPLNSEDAKYCGSCWDVTFRSHKSLPQLVFSPNIISEMPRRTSLHPACTLGVQIVTIFVRETPSSCTGAVRK